MKVRRQLWTWPISAKRYALLRESEGEFKIFDNKEHGLGHLLNPTPLGGDDRDWRREIWRWAVASDLGDPFEEPEWFNLPAVSRVRASSPILMGPFASLNDGLAYAAQIKPFNFLLSAHVSPNGHPAGTDPTRFHLVAKYEDDPAKWTGLTWIDLYSRLAYRVGTQPDTPPSWARVKTYKDVAEFFRTHPEPKSADREGSPVTPDTVGLLRRRAVRSVGFEYHWKESNRLEEVQGGMIHDVRDVGVHYDPSLDAEWERQKHRLHDYPKQVLAEVAEVTERYISKIRNGHVDPSVDVKRALLSFLREVDSVRTDDDAAP